MLIRRALLLATVGAAVGCVVADAPRAPASEESLPTQGKRDETSAPEDPLLAPIVDRAQPRLTVQVWKPIPLDPLTTDAWVSPDFIDGELRDRVLRAPPVTSCVVHASAGKVTQTEPLGLERASLRTHISEDSSPWTTLTALLRFAPNDDALDFIACYKSVPFRAPGLVLTYADVQQAFWNLEDGAYLLLEPTGE